MTWMRSKSCGEYEAEIKELLDTNERLMRMVERQLNPPMMADKDGNICSIPTPAAMLAAERQTREANQRASDFENAVEERDIKIAALQSEIEAMTAGAEGYKRRIADLEAEKVVSGWDPSRPRYVASLSSGPDKRPTMMELRLLRVEDADTLRFGEIITEVHVTVRRLRRR
jgi:hypothetical protein